MDYSKAFKGYNVPENIKNVAILISKRFTINGICDPMYISNTIANSCGIGDGMSNFTGEDVITNTQAIAERLQWAYGCNILKSEIPELKEIIDTGCIDRDKAVNGMKDFIKRIKQEKQTCDVWRIDYLNNCIESLEENILVFK